jgi:hypothetical protein
MLHKKIKMAMLGCGSIFILAGCYKDKTVLIVKTEEITTPVSFSKDIIPIFSKNCTMSGCHSTGGQVPDLTANNARRGLFEQDLVDVNDPANSEVMGWLTGTIKPAMPLGAATNPSNINALMLAWIKQGAKNN